MTDEDKRAEEPSGDAASQNPPVEDAEVVEEKATSHHEQDHGTRTETQARGGRSFLGMVLGGAVAAGAGFGLAQVVPQGWPFAQQGQSDSRLEQQADEISALKATVAELAARPVPDQTSEIAGLRQDVEARIASLASKVDPGPAIEDLGRNVDSALAGFQARLDAIEKASTGSGGGTSSIAVAAFERDLAALRSRIDELAGTGPAATSQIEQAVANAKAELASAVEQTKQLGVEAAAATQAARLDAAVGRITAALEAGGPYSSAVSDLTAGGIEVPTPLAEQAQSGVPTLADLQRGFAPSARMALDVALRSDVGDGWTDRLNTFLRTQTGARSLVPREGDDPDAILSRADAALQASDVTLALSELQALPEPARAAMSGWLADATTRAAAVAALATVAAAVDTQ